MIGFVLPWLGGGSLDRIWQTAQSKFDPDPDTDPDTEREKERGEVIRVSVRVQAQTRQTAMQPRFCWHTWHPRAAQPRFWWALINLDTTPDLPIVAHDLSAGVTPYANQIFNAVLGRVPVPRPSKPFLAQYGGPGD